MSKRCKTICYGFNNPQALILISNDRRNADGIQDASCAAENIQLAATSFGLGATWINALMTICDEPEIREKLDQYQIPKTHNVWAMIAVGWPEALQGPGPQDQRGPLRGLIPLFFPVRR